jgi:LDH2 family malate/lactate/ureidoglycolate dehydrogenase
LRSEKDIRLRIDLLEGQSGSIAKMLAKAMQEHNEEAVKQYSEKLAQGKGRVEELMWVLQIKSGQGVLDARVAVGQPGQEVAVRDLLEMLKEGRLKMDDLPQDVQALVRRGALEMKNAFKNSA